MTNTCRKEFLTSCLITCSCICSWWWMQNGEAIRLLSTQSSICPISNHLLPVVTCFEGIDVIIPPLVAVSFEPRQKFRPVWNNTCLRRDSSKSGCYYHWILANSCDEWLRLNFTTKKKLMGAVEWRLEVEISNATNEFRNQNVATVIHAVQTTPLCKPSHFALWNSNLSGVKISLEARKSSQRFWNATNELTKWISAAWWCLELRSQMHGEMVTWQTWLGGKTRSKHDLVVHKKFWNW